MTATPDAPRVQPNRRPTIKDLSERAGVSTYTVSQALAGKPGVALETRERVLSVATELGYLPNRLAASLKESVTTTVGVLTASGRNQYYAMLVQAIDSVLQDNGYHVVSNDAMRGNQYSIAAEQAGVEELLQQRVAGVITTYGLREESLALLEKWGVPVVFVDSLPPDGAHGHAFVGVDNEAASATVANYLADLLHRRVAFLAFPREWTTRFPREQGFKRAAKNRAMDVEVVESDNSPEDAAATVGRMLDRPRSEWPTAIFATNTLLLQGTMKALRAHGVAIPGEMSVVGFDDFDWAELVDPPLTVVDQHIAEIGSAAGRTVLQAIQSARTNTAQPSGVTLDAVLVIRESCAAPRVA
jgi:LacI family transcriptional regulator